MKHMRPLEMVLLVFAIIVLVASMFAVGAYGPELVKFIQNGGGTGVENSSIMNTVIYRIGEMLNHGFSSAVNARAVEILYNGIQ